MLDYLGLQICSLFLHLKFIVVLVKTLGYSRLCVYFEKEQKNLTKDEPKFIWDKTPT